MIKLLHRSCGWLAAASLTLAAALAIAEPSPSPPRARVNLDHSGHERVGIASYYAHYFSGRKMADGTPMRPESDNAASRTLPLGTKALVTSLRDGRTAVVTIRDRGPYAKGRIIDLSPRTARQLGFLKEGVVRVAVTPMTVPQPNGSIKYVVAMAEQSELAGERRVD